MHNSSVGVDHNEEDLARLERAQEVRELTQRSIPQVHSIGRKEPTAGLPVILKSGSALIRIPLGRRHHSPHCQECEQPSPI